MKSWWATLALVFALGPGCDAGPAEADPDRELAAVVSENSEAAAVDSVARDRETAAAGATVAHGKDLVAKYECNRCHTLEGIEPTTLEFDCAGCHQSIQDGSFEIQPAKLAEFQARVTSLTDVPVLAGTGRFRRDWLATFIADAHDVRPNLGPTMPRFRMPAADAQALAAFLSPREEGVAPALGNPEAGRELIENKGCISCHRFSGVPSLAAMPVAVPVTAEVLSRGQKLAPDLRFARDRMRTAALVQWLQDPGKLKPDTVMPNMGLTETEARDVAAYLTGADLEPIAYSPMPQRLPLLTREVRYDEVNGKIFGAICRHCHSDPEVVIGDGGPGYVGGFGFPTRKLDLSTYEGLRSGSLDDDGKRRSVFAKTADGDPRIVAHLWARHAEVAGKPVEGVRGMPLGLPPIPAEDIQLLETWIAQGRKKTSR